MHLLFHSLSEICLLFQIEHKPSRKHAHNINGVCGVPTTDGTPGEETYAIQMNPENSMLIKAVIYLGFTDGSQRVHKPPFSL